MKKILIIMMFSLPTFAFGQKGLNINKLFDGRYRGNKQVTETLVKGKKMEAFDLDIYHSLAIADASQVDEVERLVLEDAKKADQKEVSYIGQKLYYGFYCFNGNTVHPYRYIFYLNKMLKGGKEVVVIYMDGNANRIQVRKMLKK